MADEELLRQIAEAVNRAADSQGRIADNIKENIKVFCDAENRRNLQEEIGQERKLEILAQDQEMERYEAGRNDRSNTIQNSIRWATWSAFIAAVIYGGVAFFQWQEMARANRIASSGLMEARQASDKQLEMSHEQRAASDVQFREDQRAWVGIQEYRFGDASQNDGKNTVELEVTNTGKTPALDVTLGTKKGTRRYPVDWNTVPSSHKLQWKLNSIGALAPQAPRAIDIAIELDGLKGPDSVAGVYAGFGIFYTYGEIRYRTVFTSDWHYTTYCFYFRKGMEHPFPCPDVKMPMN